MNQSHIESNYFPINTSTFYIDETWDKDFFEVLCSSKVLMEEIVFVLCGKVDRLTNPKG